MADISNEFYYTDIVTNLSYKTTSVSNFSLYEIEEKMECDYDIFTNSSNYTFKTTIKSKDPDVPVFDSYEIYPGTVLKGKNGNPSYGIKENNLRGDTKYSSSNFEDEALNTDKLQYSKLRYGENNQADDYFKALRSRYYLSTVSKKDRNIRLLVEPYIILPLEIPAFFKKEHKDPLNNETIITYEFNDFYYKDYYKPADDLNNRLWILKDIDTIKKFSRMFYDKCTSDTFDYDKNFLILNIAGAEVNTDEIIGVYDDFPSSVKYKKIYSNDVAISYIIKLWNDWLSKSYDKCVGFGMPDETFTWDTFKSYLLYMKDNDYKKLTIPEFDDHGNKNTQWLPNYEGQSIPGSLIIEALLPLQSNNIDHLNGNMFIRYNDKSYQIYDKYYSLIGQFYHIDLICHKSTDKGTFLYPINKNTGEQSIFQSFVGATNESPKIFEGLQSNVDVDVICKELILGVSYVLGTYAYNVAQTYTDNNINNGFFDSKTSKYTDKTGNKIFIPYALYNNNDVSLKEVSEEIANELDKKIEKEVLLTPNEYYSSSSLTGEYETGEVGFEKIYNKSEIIGADLPTWFWSNTLKNWCVFNFSGIHDNIQLYMWNGQNGWDSFIDVIKAPMKYVYDINKLRFGVNLSSAIRYNGMSFYCYNVILTNDTVFSQYDDRSFQTKRIGKCWSNDLNELKRFPFTIGIPTIMRLASGEIALLYNCTIPGPTSQHPLVYPENIKFINMMCRDYFTAGDDKTIADDWKRLQGSKKISDTPSAIYSMTESSLVDADEINTVKDKTDSLIMTFTPFKQYIETDNIESDSFVERWN